MYEMSTQETLKQFEEITDFYIEQLNGFSMEQLTLQPAEDKWSLGQMYMHLKNTAMFMQLRNIELCQTAAHDSQEQSAIKTVVGEAVFSQGAFPPAPIHVPPSPQYTPQQPNNKEELIHGLQSVLKRMQEIEPSIDGLSADYTTVHPRLGALNGKEWFALVGMHYRHHLHQMERLKIFLDAANT
jgi:hypothetical protein